MKNRKAIIVLLSTMLVAIGASVTATAEAIGDAYSVGGYNAGWVFIGIAIVVGALIYLKIIKKDIAKKAGVFGVALLLVGLAMAFVETADTPSADITGVTCPDFEITGTAIATGANYVTTAVWDEDTLTLTVPITVSDSSAGNLSAHKTGVNLTFDPIGSGFTADDIVTVTASSDYLMKYGGEYVLDEDSTGYEAEVTTTEGTEDYTDSVDITADSSDWMQYDYIFNNGTAGNWVDELSAIGDSVTWYITCSNHCGTWTETITVQAIVVSYTE